MNQKKRILWSVLVLFLVAVAIVAVLFGIWKKEEKQERENKKQEDVIQKETEDNSLKSEEAESEETGTGDTTIIFAGDVLLSDYVLENYKNQGIGGVVNDTLLSQLQSADITVVNEEFPFGTTGTKAEDKQFTFRVNPSYITVSQEMGVDAVTLANNHVLDFGEEALLETMETLDSAGILYAGAGDSVERAKQVQKMEVNGKTYGMLAASRVIPVTSWNVENHTPGVFCTYDATALVKEIQQAKKKCDYLAVYVHWGVERNNQPEDYQRNLAKQYIDAGADVVIGSHPHVLQGIEFYQGKPIFYSLGNFIFNQSIDKTMAVKLEIPEEGEPIIRLLPASAQNARTGILEDTGAEELYRYVESISEGVSVDENGVVSQN